MQIFIHVSTKKNLNLTWRSSHSEIDKLIKPTYNLQKSYRIIKIYVSGVKILTHTQIMRYNVSLSFSLLKIKMFSYSIMTGKL